MRDQIAGLYSRILHAIRPAKQTANSIVSGGPVSVVQAQFNQFEVRESNSMQLYGFASATLAGTDLIVVNVAGDNSNGVVIASNHQSYRPQNMLGGECQIYDSTGQYVYISQQGGGIILINANTQLVITAPSVRINGNLQVTGSVIAGYGTGDSVTVQHHTHNQPDDSHGDTEEPTDAPNPNT